MTPNTAEGGHLLGSLRSEAGKGIVHIEDRFEASVDDLWSALTEPARLARWYGEVEGDLRPGGAFHIYVESDDWRGVGRVQECEAPKRLRVTTRESDESYRKGQGVPPFDQSIDATLAAFGDHTDLVIEVGGLPLDAIAFYGVGWQIHAEHLAAYLGGRQGGDTEARWNELIPGYQGLAADIG